MRLEVFVKKDVGILSHQRCNIIKVTNRICPHEFLRSIDAATQLFPGRTSLDIIFGRPNHLLSDWEVELGQVLQLCDDHLSLYQLTLERGTQLFKSVHDNKLTLPTDEEMADMYLSAIYMLENSGFERYEASNFAKQGARSTHNEAYWTGSQYIGIGPGAHGRFVPVHAGASWREARIQTLEPDPWMWEVENKGHAARKATPQCTRQILEEILMLGLRTKEGLPEKRWRQFGACLSLEETFRNNPYVSCAIDEGLLNLDESGLQATQRGLNVVDSITPHLLAHLNIYDEKEEQ